MESKTSSGQILIECALALVVFALLMSALLDFDTKKQRGHMRIKKMQTLNFREFRNEE